MMAETQTSKLNRHGSALASPMGILNAARRAVPAVNYALGAAGIAAAGAIIVGLLGHGRASIIIVGAMFCAMIMLFAFARLVAAKSPAAVNAGIVMLWSVTLFFCGFLALTVTAFTFKWPDAWREFLGISPSFQQRATEPQTQIEMVTKWVDTLETARKNGTIHAKRPLPNDVAEKRAVFESWWQNTGLAERRQLPNALLYKALSLNSRLYRMAELENETKPNSTFWNDQCLSYFEQLQDKTYITEALLDRAALYLELSQIEHTDPDKFRRIAEDGDAVMARAVSLGNADQQVDLFRTWSRFYYNLARPKTGLLSQKWDNNYLSLAYQKAKTAQEMKPDELKNATQLARATQRFAANPPQDKDAFWTKELRRVQQMMLTSFDKSKNALTTPAARIPPLDIIGVLTMDVVRREWSSGAQGADELAKTTTELNDVSIPALREAWALVRHTEWVKDYQFDLNYDLGRIQAVLVQILDTHNGHDADGIFADLIVNMEAATKAATTTQVRAALAAIESDPNLAGLRVDRRDQVKLAFTLK
jgi:hypothetical protein